jgi:hypothetical protein
LIHLDASALIIHTLGLWSCILRGADMDRRRSREAAAAAIVEMERAVPGALADPETAHAAGQPISTPR